MKHACSSMVPVCLPIIIILCVVIVEIQTTMHMGSLRSHVIGSISPWHAGVLAWS